MIYGACAARSESRVAWMLVALQSTGNWPPCADSLIGSDCLQAAAMCRLAIARGDGNISLHDPVQAAGAQAEQCAADARASLQLRKRSKHCGRSAGGSSGASTALDAHDASQTQRRLNGTARVLGADGAGHRASVGAATFVKAFAGDPEGHSSELLVSGGDDRQLIAWDVQSIGQDGADAELVRAQVRHGRKVNALCGWAAQHGGTRIVVADTSKRVSVYALDP
jgi:hypothetical protein